jgi:hypothetical protein
LLLQGYIYSPPVSFRAHMVRSPGINHPVIYKLSSPSVVVPIAPDSQTVALRPPAPLGLSHTLALPSHDIRRSGLGPFWSTFLKLISELACGLIDASPRVPRRYEEIERQFHPKSRAHMRNTRTGGYHDPNTNLFTGARGSLSIRVYADARLVSVASCDIVVVILTSILKRPINLNVSVGNT